jgi:Cupin superfamily protein
MMTFDARAAARALTGGMSIHTFNADVREKRAARFEGALKPEMLGEVFDFVRLESLLSSEGIPLAYIDVFDEGQLTRLVDMQYKSGKTGLAVVAARFSGGSTIRVRDIDRFDVRLGSLAKEIQRLFAARSQINLYLTPPGKSGFAPHFDITDVFILQCLGAKQWRLFEEYSNRIDLPLMDTNWDPERFKPLSVPDPITLSAGDVLYMPRGVMHQAFCIERESMHLTISLMPLTISDLISRELQRVGADHIQFRQRVPWSVEEDAGNANEQIVQLVKSCLSELSESLDVETLLGTERQALAARTVKGDGANELTHALTALRQKFEMQPQNVS